MSMDYETRYVGLVNALRDLPASGLRGAIPVGLLDQLDAATADAQRRLLAAAAVDPDVHGQLDAPDPGLAVRAWARLFAAFDASWRWCPHIRRNPAQPALAVLPLRRVDCQRCARTLRNPPPGEDDWCDLCGRRGVSTFWPVRWHFGPLLAIGDMCGACHGAVFAAECST